MPKASMETDEVVRRGRAIYERAIRHLIEDEHDGDFVVVDVNTGAWEVDRDDVVASERALARHPEAVLYFARVGRRTAYRIGRR